MSTFANAMQRAERHAKHSGESFFIYHQPEAWETRDTGWHVVDQTEYYRGIVVIDEQTVRCSVTWDEEAGEPMDDEFHPWYYSTWQEQ